MTLYSSYTVSLYDKFLLLHIFTPNKIRLCLISQTINLIYLVTMNKIELHFNKMLFNRIIRACNFTACEISHTN